MTANNKAHQRDTEGRPLRGIDRTRIYGIWQNMHQRCYNTKNTNYPNYGAKGITVCEEWNRDNINGFFNFRQWSLANGYREDLTIDRINVNGDYEPMNCQWATMKEQERNRTNNHPVTVDSITYHSLAEACEELNRMEDYDTIYLRIHCLQWSADRAFTEPIEEQGQNKRNPVTINGTQYKSIAECCRNLNINKKAVERYMYNHGTTAEEAIYHYIDKSK